MNKNTFLKSISVLESAFDKKLSKGAINIYWSRIKKYTDSEFKKAVIRCVDELNYFPKVAELKNILEGTSEDEAELAWICLLNKIEREDYYKSVSFPDYPAIGAVVEAMGGWIEICDMKIDEEKWVKKEFIKMYPIMKKRGDYPDKLIGQFELDNGNKYTKKFMLEEFGRQLDGKKVDRKLIEDNSNPHSIVETGGKEERRWTQ